MFTTPFDIPQKLRFCVFYLETSAPEPKFALNIVEIDFKLAKIEYFQNFQERSKNVYSPLKYDLLKSPVVRYSVHHAPGSCITGGACRRLATNRRRKLQPGPTRRKLASAQSGARKTKSDALLTIQYIKVRNDDNVSLCFIL